MVSEQEEYKVLVASLRGEVGRLSEQLRLVSAERDRADAMRAASQSGREVEELQKQLLESLRAEVARHAEQHQIAMAERDEMRKQACELGSGLRSMPLLRPFAVAGVQVREVQEELLTAAQGHKDVLVRAMQASSNEKAEIRSGYQRDIAVLEDKLSFMAQQLQAMNERLSEGAASEAMVESLRQRVTQLEHELEDSNVNLKIAECYFFPKWSALWHFVPAYDEPRAKCRCEIALCAIDSASSSALISSKSVPYTRRRHPSWPKHFKGKRISSSD
jgi:hypothetical protein